jgi:ribosome-binding protein aMBF1 (putative translation factor)
MQQQTCPNCGTPLEECQRRRKRYGIGRVIEQLRFDAWLSRLDLAKRSNIEYSDIVKIESGAQRPTPMQILAIEKALNFRPFFILNRTMDRRIRSMFSKSAKAA